MSAVTGDYFYDKGVGLGGWLCENVSFIEFQSYVYEALSPWKCLSDLKFHYARYNKLSKYPNKFEGWRLFNFILIRIKGRIRILIKMDFVLTKFCICCWGQLGFT